MHNCTYHTYLSYNSDAEHLKPCLAGSKGRFEVLARDYFNNARTVGGDRFTAMLTGPVELKCDVIDSQAS